jgi:hypothetical protein
VIKAAVGDLTTLVGADLLLCAACDGGEDPQLVIHSAPSASEFRNFVHIWGRGGVEAHVRLAR